MNARERVAYAKFLHLLTNPIEGEDELPNLAVLAAAYMTLVGLAFKRMKGNV